MIKFGLATNMEYQDIKRQIDEPEFRTETYGNCYYI